MNKKVQKFVSKSKSLVKNYGLLAGTLALATGSAMATTAPAGGGTGSGAEFTTMLTTVLGWAQGDLGKLLAVSAFLIGMGIGIVKQSIIAIALGIGFALCLAYGPTIITDIFTFAV